MFSGLGYGEVIPAKYKIVSSLQSIIGICYIPILAAYIWMYIQDQIKFPNKIDNEIFESSGNEILSYSRDLGVLLILEDKEKIEIRNKRFSLNNCKKCESDNINILTFIDPRIFIPFNKFICQCKSCGSISKQKMNVFSAVNNWNKLNRIVNRE